jgi:hypothetical protein
MTQEVQARFAWFVHSNEAHVSWIAGRTSEQWARFTPKEPNLTALADGEKYRACRIGTHVLEVRVFRGTLSTLGFLKNVEWCAALVDYATETSFDAMTTVGLIQFARDNGGFPNLIQWIDNQGADSCVY